MGPGGQIGGEDEQVRPGQSADSAPPGPTPRWDESEDEQNGGRADDREEQTEPGLSSPRPRDEPGEERSHRQSRDRQGCPAEESVDVGSQGGAASATEDGAVEQDRARDEEDVEDDVEGDGERREVLVDRRRFLRLGDEIVDAFLRIIIGGGGMEADGARGIDVEDIEDARSQIGDLQQPRGAGRRRGQGPGFEAGTGGDERPQLRQTGTVSEARDDDRRIGGPVLRVVFHFLQTRAEAAVGFGDAGLPIEVRRNGIGVVRDRVEQPGADADRTEIDDAEAAVRGRRILREVRHHSVFVRGGIGGAGTFGRNAGFEQGILIGCVGAGGNCLAGFGNGACEHSIVDGVPGADIGLLDRVEALDPRRRGSGYGFVGMSFITLRRVVRRGGPGVRGIVVDVRGGGDHGRAAGRVIGVGILGDGGGSGLRTGARAEGQPTGSRAGGRADRAHVEVRGRALGEQAIEVRSALGIDIIDGQARNAEDDRLPGWGSAGVRGLRRSGIGRILRRRGVHLGS